MAIVKVKVSNFKSFKDLEVKLGKFNVLIGANASGKSNFIQIFKFLRDIRDHGLEEAIFLQGGIEYLRNINIGPSKNLLLEVVFDFKEELPIGEEEFPIGELPIGENTLHLYQMIYRVVVGFKKKRFDFEIVEDKLIVQFNIIKNHPVKENLGQGEVIVFKVKKRVYAKITKLPEGVRIKMDKLISRLLREEKHEPRSLLLEILRYPFTDLSPLLLPYAYYNVSKISIYNFDPKLSKKAVPIIGKAELEEDGSNLPIVLKNILEDKGKRRKLSNLINDLLPYVKGLNVEKFPGKSLFFKLRESYTKKRYLPAPLISDGTINIITLIIALYFEEKWLTIIEEPERNIHPYLISKVIDMMKDASRNKQIIVTTHNPEVVKHAGLDNILLISRDKEGFSVITKPYEKETVKIFLENEMGIDELYVQNLLEL